MGLSVEGYTERLLQALPPGVAWRRDPDSVFAKLAAALAVELALVDARADDLLDEADPRTTEELIDEWERALALPDECFAAAVTLEDRRAAVLSKLTGVAEPTVVGLEALATAIGVPATITEAFQAKVGVSVAGGPLNGAPWAHSFYVHGGATTVTTAAVGTARAGDSLRDWGSEVLECAIRAAKPAHTQAIYTYDA